MKPEVKKEIISWVFTIGIAIVIALVVNTFIIVNATVPTGSMKNTINEGDRVMAFRWSYIFSEPKRGHIIVFKFPDKESELFVKRVIGLPGDKVEIIEGKVYINDSDVPLDEPYLHPVEETRSFGPYIVPEGSYFMMGDNRTDSNDSRSWHNTFVKKDKILGKLVFRYFPMFKTY